MYKPNPRFIARKPDENGHIWIHDMESGAGVICVEDNHDWFWIDEEIDPTWDEREYIRRIAEQIVKVLNESEIPKPSIET